MSDLKPDAILCQTQSLAVIAGQHLKAVGFRAGRDPLLAAFADPPMTGSPWFPLTTVRFPVKRFAKICCERLLAQTRHSSDQDMGLTLVCGIGGASLQRLAILGAPRLIPFATIHPGSYRAEKTVGENQRNRSLHIGASSIIIRKIRSENGKSSYVYLMAAPFQFHYL
jgi:hypothetical protein